MRSRRPVQQSINFTSNELSTSKTQIKSKSRTQHHERNREAGAYILADPHRFGGESSLPVRWARLFFTRHSGKD
jgi:hypothetical protein